MQVLFSLSASSNYVGSKNEIERYENIILPLCVRGAPVVYINIESLISVLVVGKQANRRLDFTTVLSFTAFLICKSSSGRVCRS